jgi:hypothetical protein
MLPGIFALCKTAKDLKELGFGVIFGFRLSRCLRKSAVLESSYEEER